MRHSQQRRDLDQQKLEDLKVEMGLLEKDFSTEVQRRKETSTSLHSVRGLELAKYLRGLNHHGPPLSLSGQMPSWLS